MNTIKKHLESIRQFSFPRTRALEQELDTVSEALAAISAELTNVREELQRTHEDDGLLLADLRRQVKQGKSEHGHAQYQIEVLERSLVHAEQRQKFTETHVESLEMKLEEERKRYEEHMHATETRQAHMLAEQQSQLKQQTELADSFHRVSTRLFESMKDSNNKRRYSLPQLMIVACMLLLIGTLIGGGYTQILQGDSQEQALMEQDISDMHGFMKQHIDNQDVLIKQLSLALNSQLVTEQALVVEEPPEDSELPPEAAEPQQEAVSFMPDIRELQASLLKLGFDLGIAKPNGELGVKTRQALQEFRRFYLSHDNVQAGVISEPLVAMILSAADFAKADAVRFSVSNDVLAAIRLGSIRTGLDFSFLMELASVESDFNPTVRAPNSSATGLFQFKDNSWLEAIRTFGADYGLKDYATQVELIDDEGHEQQPNVRDSLQLEVLALRLNPRLSTLLAAENIKRNLRNLSQVIGRELGRTDLYLPHFFGPTGARLFLKILNEEPAAIAAEIFPEAAARNRNVFQNRQHQSRSVAEVYAWFGSKFNTALYDERNPG
jgi:peptidoglycan hydrolase-like protein with peptidoglycan-binding domain